MGKNRDRESLIRKIVNILSHEIVARHTNRPESTHFLNSEIIEYRSDAEKTAETHNWNSADKEYIKEKSLKKVIEKLKEKYSDVKYTEQEVIIKLKEIMNEMI